MPLPEFIVANKEMQMTAKSFYYKAVILLTQLHENFDFNGATENAYTNLKTVCKNLATQCSLTPRGEEYFKQLNSKIARALPLPPSRCKKEKR